MPFKDTQVVHLHGVLVPAASLISVHIGTRTEEVATDSDVENLFPNPEQVSDLVTPDQFLVLLTQKKGWSKGCPFLL